MAECAIFDAWHSWVGQRVCIKGNQRGTLRYFGKTEFDGIWCGIELDKPLGENDGMVNNVSYFNCEANHGIFVPVLETTKIYNEIDINAACCLTNYSSNVNSNKDASKDIQETVFQCANVALNKTFNINVSDISNENFRKGFKRSERKHFAVLDSEESLGILSDLLEDDPSYFSPSISDFPEPSEKTNLITVTNKISEGLDSVFLDSVTFTSTPKHSIDTYKFESDVGSRLKPKKFHNLIQGDHSPIDIFHAESAEMKSEIDFDLSWPNETKILSSTKTLSGVMKYDNKTSFPYTNTIEKESSSENMPESKGFGSNLDVTQIFSENKDDLMCKDILHQDIDRLNTTFKIESTSLPKYNSLKLPLNINIAPLDDVDGLDFTFVVADDTIQNESKEETFVIDCSSGKIAKRFELSECLKKQTRIEEEVPSEKALTKTITDKAMEENKSSPKILGIVDKLGTSHKETVKNTFFGKSGNCFPCKPTCVSKRVSNNADAFQNLNSTFCLNSIKSKPQVNSVLRDISKRHSLSTVSFANKQNSHKFKPEFKEPLAISSKADTKNIVPTVQTLGKVKKLHFKASENVDATLKKCDNNAQVLNETISYSTKKDIKRNGKCVEDIFDSSVCCSKSIPAKENIKCSKSSPRLNLEMKLSRSSMHTMENNVAFQSVNELVVNKHKMCMDKTKTVLGTYKVKPENFSVKRKTSDFQTNVSSRVSRIGSVNKTVSKSLKVNSQNTRTLPQKIKSEDIGKGILSVPISKLRNFPISVITTTNGNQTNNCTTNSALSKCNHRDFESVSNGIVELDNKLSKTLIFNNSKELSARTCETLNAQVPMDLEIKTSTGIGTSSDFSKTGLQGRKGIPTVKQNGFKKGRTSLLPAPTIIKRSVTISDAVKSQAQLPSEISPNCISTSRKFPTRKLQSPRSYRIKS